MKVIDIAEAQEDDPSLVVGQYSVALYLVKPNKYVTPVKKDVKFYTHKFMFGYNNWLRLV